MAQRTIVESISLMVAGGGLLLTLLMFVVVLIKLRGNGNGNGKGHSVLTEGERNALYNTSRDAKMISQQAATQTEILRNQERTLSLFAERFSDYTRSVNEGLPRYICRYQKGE